MLNTFKLRDPAGARYTVMVLLYITSAYIGGWIGIFQDNVGFNTLGVIALAHSMLIAAYLLHDCGHNAVFLSTQGNAHLGKVLNWIVGSSYGRYEDIRYKHMRHHVDNYDPVVWDYRSFLKRHPTIETLVKAAEWAYIPAIEIMMHTMLVIAPWCIESKREQRYRVLRVVLVRGGLLTTALLISPVAFCLYVLAQLLLLSALRFMDCYQHNYEVIFNLDEEGVQFPHKGDAEYEQSHTYSNLLSNRFPCLNLLVLNFCYHNAHHVKPTLGWYRLPTLHKTLHPSVDAQTLDFWTQARSFHRHRIARIQAEDYGDDEVKQSLQEGRAVGVDGLSFLTAF
ncbi:fatty acid desaturase [Halieaceae bacterium IMCC14734]|uniref:Fatty acid desaturase n=1 Tax=Candidatus Litorirhabdus singularis TaxID=2518993 RepID=A0ABT3THC7_9GAMM|nr:fatty acid desaturase [Candidatus Litorirhabdus singularis]MCX2980792.1 fatty acid desaturase [Candidatus Litorirhabdus singularis]